MSKISSTFDWDSYFSSQAAWTKNLREFLSVQLGINSSSKVLEIGCGTGVILRELSKFCGCKLFGIDIDFDRLKTAKRLAPDQILICSDANNLPFMIETFDFAVFHYFLLWIKEPIRVLRNTLQVLRQDGYAIAFAEPDYKSRIEYPAIFENIGKLQTRSLRQQGANPNIGRKIPGIFSEAGFKDVQYGTSGFQRPAIPISQDKSSEWKILEEDLKKINSESVINKFRSMDDIAIKKGERVSWVPTFYTFGKKP